jgi:gluconate 5-dehydrogenase
MGLPGEVLDAVGYSASKGAIISMTRDLAAKWGRHRIRVNAVAPGFFETKLTAGVLARSQSGIERFTPIGRIGRAGELKGVMQFLASAASAYVTGHVLAVDGGATAW